MSSGPRVALPSGSGRRGLEDVWESWQPSCEQIGARPEVGPIVRFRASRRGRGFPPNRGPLAFKEKGPAGAQREMFGAICPHAHNRHPPAALAASPPVETSEFDCAPSKPAWKLVFRAGASKCTSDSPPPAHRPARATQKILQAAYAFGGMPVPLPSGNQREPHLRR